VTPLSLDITSTAQIQAAASQVESLDMLINNAGIALPDDLTDPAVLERHLAVNPIPPQRPWLPNGAIAQPRCSSASSHK
jgi:NAD(P)-dependent dehydrogenase (short-subunit alcohol dehydrogenase family)